MASMKDIKRRRMSIQNTQQITKAMKLVSTVKLQRARTRAENAKEYFDSMYKSVTSMLEKTEKINHPYLEAGKNGKIGIVAITSNRGLAGGYNSNIVKMIRDCGFKKEDLSIYAIGQKGLDALRARRFQIEEDYSAAIEDVDYREAAIIADRLLKDFKEGKLKEIYVAYTEFKNTVSHIPKFLKLLPIEEQAYETNKKEQAEVEDKEDALLLMNFEPSPEEVLDLLIPKYMSSMIYGALIEASASENGARMQAMDNATDNAQEMIDSLGLIYNRARQGSITQELTEIIAGADALGS